MDRAKILGKVTLELFGIVAIALTFHLMQEMVKEYWKAKFNKS